MAQTNLSLDFLKYTDDSEAQPEVKKPDEMGFLAKKKFKAEQAKLEELKKQRAKEETRKIIEKAKELKASGYSK